MKARVMVRVRVMSTRVCVCLCEVRASDKRITCDEEFSDSEDEGEGGRRHQDSYKHKRIRLDDKTADAGGKTAAAPPPPAEKSLYCTSSVVCVVISLDRLVPPSISTHTHTFNGPLSGTTQVQSTEGKTSHTHTTRVANFPVPSVL